MRLFYIEELEHYKTYLVELEKGKATIEKYLRDIRTFHAWLGGEPGGNQGTGDCVQKLSEGELQGHQHQQYAGGTEPVFPVSGLDGVQRQRFKIPTADVLSGVPGIKAAGIRKAGVNRPAEKERAAGPDHGDHCRNRNPDQ